MSPGRCGGWGSGWGQLGQQGTEGGGLCRSESAQLLACRPLQHLPQLV